MVSYTILYCDRTSAGGPALKPMLLVRYRRDFDEVLIVLTPVLTGLLLAQYNRYLLDTTAAYRLI